MRVITFGAFDFDGVIGGRGAGGLVAEVHARDFVEGHARLPRFGLGEEIGLQMPAHQADAVRDALHER